MKNIYALMIVLLASTAQAGGQWSFQVSAAKPAGAFPVGVGSRLVINSPYTGTSAGILLGQLLNADGSFNSMMVLDANPVAKSLVVEYIPAALVAQAPAGQQNVLKLYEQQGGTCTGYAIDDFLLQAHMSGFTGTSKLGQQLSTEEGRTELLADTINQYYLVLQHRFSINGIMNQYGKTFGFNCGKSIFSTAAQARAYLMTALRSGMPILLSFDVGSEMYNGPFPLQQMIQGAPAEDGRLWQPRKIGERNGGGHSVVAASAFSIGGKDYLVMLDSDWDLPRVWDLNAAISDRAAIGEIEFYSCR